MRQNHVGVHSSGSTSESKQQSVSATGAITSSSTEQSPFKTKPTKRPLRSDSSSNSTAESSSRLTGKRPKIKGSSCLEEAHLKVKQRFEKAVELYQEVKRRGLDMKLSAYLQALNDMVAAGKEAKEVCSITSPECDMSAFDLNLLTELQTEFKQHQEHARQDDRLYPREQNLRKQLTVSNKNLAELTGFCRAYEAQHGVSIYTKLAQYQARSDQLLEDWEKAVGAREERKVALSKRKINAGGCGLEKSNKILDEQMTGLLKSELDACRQAEASFKEAKLKLSTCPEHMLLEKIKNTRDGQAVLLEDLKKVVEKRRVLGASDKQVNQKMSDLWRQWMTQAEGGELSLSRVVENLLQQIREQATEEAPLSHSM